MKQPAHRRHDLTDHQWHLIESHLPGRKGSQGGQAVDNRQFINAVFWILRTGAPWRDLPPDYGGWGDTHRSFIRWRNKGIWTKLMLILVGEKGMEWLMVDATHIKLHPHAAVAKGGNEGMSRTKGG